MTDKTGGSAFPAQPVYRMPDGTEVVVPQNGMTLRDYFAAKAMQGMLSNQHQFQSNDEAGYARDAYILADAMIAARGDV